MMFTLLMGLLRHMRDVQAGHSVVLLYGDPDKDQAVFHQGISEIEAGGHPDLKAVDVLSDPGDDWNGESGHIDGEKIIRHWGRPVTRENVRHQLADPYENMPVFRDRLTRAQQNAIIAYLETLDALWVPGGAKQHRHAVPAGPYAVKQDVCTADTASPKDMSQRRDTFKL